MSIAILCPTRGRPEQCKRMVDSARSTTTEYLSIRLRVSDDDERIEDYRKSSLSFYSGNDYPTVFKWNLLANTAMEDSGTKLFMLGSDDTIFASPGWDKALLDHYNALENKIHVYALQDSRDKDGTPHPIVTREYIEAMGYFMPPIFLHWYVDSWTVEIAKMNNCFTHMREFELIHDKPSDKGQPDETHNRIRRMGWHERDSYVNARCRNFLSHEKVRLAHIISENHHRKFRESLCEI